MLKRIKVALFLASLLFALHPAVADAQPSAQEDAIIRPIQRLQSIGEGDQGRIGRWVRNRVKELTSAAGTGEPMAFRTFRERLGELYRDPQNTQAFKTELVVQVTQLATDKFADTKLDGTVALALARVLVDMGGRETYAGLVAGLKLKDQGTRLLCAKGLEKLQSHIAQDKAKLDQTVVALREAGVVERNSVSRSWVYLALAYPDQVEAVFDAFMAIFDTRLELRRGAAVFVDRAEVDAFDFFRQSGVLSSLSSEQKSALAQRLAVFLRFDAQRYSAENVPFAERENLERRLVSLEECLEFLVGSGGGDIRGELRAGGHERRDAVAQQAYRWIGHPTTQKPGALNEAPWGVPIGAP